MTMTLPVLVAASLLGTGALLACASGGAGNDPSFGAAPSDLDADDTASGDASDDSPTGDDGASPDADTCDDPAHGAVALFTALGGHATMCTSTSQCEAGQCCFANSSVSACVMQ